MREGGTLLDYPITLNLRGKPVLIVGGGAVAGRKARRLLQAEAQVTVVSPQLHPDFPHAQVSYVGGVYRRQHLVQFKPVLVFAATDDPVINHQVAEDARVMGVFVNVVDGSADSDFHNMTELHRDRLTVAISTGGAGPMLGQHLRGIIAEVVGEHYAVLAEWLAELRPQVQANIDEAQARRAFWQDVLKSDVLALLADGQHDTAYARLLQLYDASVRELA